MKKLYFLAFSLCLTLFLNAQTITISDPLNWTVSQMNQYVGKTITFASPIVVCNNYYYWRGEYTVSAHRIFSPTNQALPSTPAYNTIVSLNNNCQVKLKGLSGSDYHRIGEKIENLKVRVTAAGEWEYVSGTFVGNTRAEMETGYPSVDIRGEHNLLVCAMNLEYFLAEQFDASSSMGPDNAAEHEKQKTKIKAALNKIRADIFGFVEVQQGQRALEELAEMLTEITGKQYDFINDGTSANGTYTKSGYVYCKEKVTPAAKMMSNNTVVVNRKKMLAFTDNATGEKFIFSLNHFKAKSGSATGADANQGDGQGIFNASRKKEAQSVLTEYNYARSFYGDDDILIMGDLNAYAKEDPIMILVNGGMRDLHRYFHGDESYSYQFHETAGYLDHALANSTMLGQITGMTPYHINSDEHDNFTYDKSNDATMFRCSDHDPIIVGLRLGDTLSNEDAEKHCTLSMVGEKIWVEGVEEGHYQVIDLSGTIITSGKITSAYFPIETELPNGFYIVNVYSNGKREQLKILK